MEATRVGDWGRGLTKCQRATRCSEEIGLHTGCTVLFCCHENFEFLGGFGHSFTFLPIGLQESEVFSIFPASLVRIQTVLLLDVTVGPF